MGRAVTLAGVILAFASLLGMLALPVRADTGMLLLSGLVLGLLLLVGGVVMAFAEGRAAERAAWGRFAEANGSALEPSMDPAGLPASISLFNWSLGRYCSDVVRVRAGGLPGRLFRYSYDSGGDTLEGPFAVLLLDAAAPGVPDFRLFPRSLLAWAGDDGLEEAEVAGTDAGAGFSALYRLRSRGSGRRFFGSARLACLARRPGLYAECRGGRLAVWMRGGGGSDAEAMLAGLVEAAGCLLGPAGG